jgi:hypothetical protein
MPNPSKLEIVETSVARILGWLDHWTVLSMGNTWMQSGRELAEHDTASAAKAFTWARSCFVLYQKAWQASNASRWDPDGQEDIDEADQELARLSGQASAPLPKWADELISGVLPPDSPQPDAVAPPLTPLAEIAQQLRASQQ